MDITTTKQETTIMKTFYDIIYEWVADNFGQSEADDPSWDIRALAGYLSEADIDPDELNASTKLQAYAQVARRYVEEDIEAVAEDKGIDLTPKQLAIIADKYMNSEAYACLDRDAIDWFINEYKGEE